MSGFVSLQHNISVSSGLADGAHSRADRPTPPHHPAPNAPYDNVCTWYTTALLYSEPPPLCPTIPSPKFHRGECTIPPCSPSEFPHAPHLGSNWVRGHPHSNTCNGYTSAADDDQLSHPAKGGGCGWGWSFKEKDIIKSN